MCLARLRSFTIYLHLSGTWLGVVPRTDTKKDMSSKKIGLRAQNVSTILYATINILGGGDLYDHSRNTRIVTLRMNKILI